jgi:antimicrobial peptide system SdpB family protein
MIERINALAKYYGNLDPWTNVYGLARTILATGTFLVLTFNSTDVLFFSFASTNASGNFSIKDIGLFYLLGYNLLWLSKTLSLIALSLVIIGWKPRLTGILHWYISYSFFTACPIIDGGDQVISIITLLLIPVTLLDQRKWHWNLPKHIYSQTTGEDFKRLFTWSMFLIIRIQVAVIYFHSAIAKMEVTEWINGTDTYYWFVNPIHGAATWLRPFVYDVMSSASSVVLITWGTIILELILAVSIFMTRGKFTWKILLISGITLHFGIVIIHGLISFFCAMSASLILYLYPLYKNINCLSRNRSLRGLKLLNTVPEKRFSRV